MKPSSAHLDVLHTLPSLSVNAGGPTEALCGLASAQTRLGLRVAVLTGHRGETQGPAYDRLHSAGVQVTNVGPVKGPLSNHPDFRQEANKLVGTAAIVHIHGVWEQVLYETARTARSMKRPYVWRPCGMLDAWSLQQSKWKKKLLLAWRVHKTLQTAAALHFTSQTEAQAADALQLRPRRIIEPNGIDLGSISLPDTEAAERAFRKKWKSLGERPIILFLGRLHPKKSPDLLIDAYASSLANWKSTTPRPVLLLVGSGDTQYEKQLEERATQAGLICVRKSSETANQERGTCVFTGLLTGSDKRNALASASIFALPSQQENFGIAAAEAAGCGVPAIVSPEVDLSEWIIKHGAGLVVERNAVKWSEALGTLLNNPDGANKIGQRAEAAALKTFDWNTIAGRWNEHYQMLNNDNA